MIDILLPYYGSAAYAYAAIQSVRAQRSREWRLVVVDDCYPDPSIGDWLDDLKDPMIEYHRNERTLGVVENFVRCLSFATNPYVTFMGCDDLMLPEHIAGVESGLLRHPSAEIIQSGVKVIDRQGIQAGGLCDRIKLFLAPRRHVEHELEGESLATSLMLGNWTYFPALTWRRSVFDTYAFNTSYDTVPDLAVLMDVVIGGGRLVVLGEETFCYRRHSSSASARSANTAQRFSEEANLHDDLARRLRRLGWVHASVAARLRISSRMHALLLVSKALTSGKYGTARLLMSHVLSGTRRREASFRDDLAVCAVSRDRLMS